MKAKTKALLAFAFMNILLIILAIISITNKVSEVKERDKQVELYNAITDSLKRYKTKDSLNVALISVMETNSAKDFLDIKNLTGTNLELQNYIKAQGKQIKDLKTALKIKTETIFIDTIREFRPISGDTIIFSKEILIDSITNKWITAKYGFNKGKSYFNLKTYDEFLVSIKDSKTGSYAEITNLNPYSTTKDIRVFNIASPKPKRYGISFNLGVGGFYGLRHNIVDYGPYVGLGLSYDLIQW